MTFTSRFQTVISADTLIGDKDSVQMAITDQKKLVTEAVIHQETNGNCH